MRKRDHETGTMTPRRRHYEHAVKALCFITGQMAMCLARGKFRAEDPPRWSGWLRELAAAIDDETKPMPAIEYRPTKPATPGEELQA